MFDFFALIGNSLESLFLSLLLLLWLYSIVYVPLKALFGWLKDKISEKRKKNHPSGKENTIQTLPQQSHEEQKNNNIADTKRSIDTENNDVFDDEFDWYYPSIRPVQQRKQNDTNIKNDKPEQIRKPAIDVRPKENDRPQRIHRHEISNKPRNVSYYKITDSNIQYLIDKGVKWLYHFTNVDNIDSILENGLVARSLQEKKQIISKYNDPNEAGSDYISVSIEWPNYKMFYKKRIDSPSEKYVVACISVYALTECQFKMYSSNASKAFGSSLVEEAKGLYYDSPSRKCLRHDKYPTDPQAELRILNVIPIKYISDQH